MTHTVTTRAAVVTTSTSASAEPERAAATWKRCDPNVRAKRGSTSCAFAENVFYGYWRAVTQGDDGFRAYSPVTGRRYSVSCTAGNVSVSCRAGDGGAVRFPRSAVDAYTDKQAEAFCRAHTATPTDDPCGPATGTESPSTAADAPDTGAADSSPSDEGGYGASDDDYTNHDGTYDGAPTTEDFGSGKGSVGLCADGTYSDSIGRSGACSHHGGVG